MSIFNYSLKSTGLKYAFDWFSILVIITLIMTVTCRKADIDIIEEPAGVDTSYISNFSDTYFDLYSFDKVYEWGPYNVHDPSILNNGDYFFCYSTDVFYNLPILRAGLQVRRSEDLVHWEFIGWAYNGRPSQAVEYITSNGGSPNDNVWAPYIMKTGGKYRLYYSQASSIDKLSAIGLTTSDSPEGPWTEEGLVVTSHPDITFMPNAIDPTVIVDDETGKHWMIYGSSWDGIYILELDPETGLAKMSGSKGRRIAHRGFTGGTMNGNIEAPEVIYNTEFNKYYMFIAYDWLSTKYNVRVGRADNADGPYYDYKGVNVVNFTDNISMNIAPYAFMGHFGWVGTAHCSVFEKDGQFFIAHQARPSVSRNMMVLHVRKIYWTEDGWPVVSPERYAGITETYIQEKELHGDWEHILFGYTVVPGFAEEQTDPDRQRADTLNIHADGTFNDDPGNKWTFTNQVLELNWNNISVDKVIVRRGWDWENKKETILFTGLNNEGTTIWGKKM